MTVVPFRSPSDRPLAPGAFALPEQARPFAIVYRDHDADRVDVATAEELAAGFDCGDTVHAVYLLRDGGLHLLTPSPIRQTTLDGRHRRWLDLLLGCEVVTTVPLTDDQADAFGFDPFGVCP